MQNVVRMRVGAVALGLALLGGCGPKDGSADAGPRTDTGRVSADGSSGTDTGIATDTGIVTDTGTAAASPLLDCRARENADAPACSMGDRFGTLGTGPAFAQDTQNEIRGGFLDVERNRLVLAVSGGQVAGNHVGAIFTMDLATGNRQIVSGYNIDARTGGTVVGAGPDVWEIFDVQPASDGQWYAAAEQGIVRIDPATGDRTIIYGPGIDTVSTDEECFWYNQGNHVNPGALNTGSFLAVVSPTHFIQEFDRLTGAGIFDIQLGAGNTASCSLIAGNRAYMFGSGADFNTFDSVYFHDGVIYARGNSGLGGTLYTVNPTTFARTAISAQRTIGRILNDADISGTVSMNGFVLGFDTDASIFEVENYTGTTCFANIDIATGDKTGHDCDGRGPGTDARVIARHPINPRLVILAGGWGVGLVDPLTERMNWFSY